MMLSRSGLLLALVTSGVSVLFACSSNNNNNNAPTSCQDSLCAKNNKCIDDGKKTECRLLCSKQEDCPEKYQCVAGPKGDVTFCAPVEGYAQQITKKDKGQWGSHCAAVLDAKRQPTPAGLDANPECDTDQSFWCYAQEPTDGDAFCTQYQCGSDAECKGGYWCATINAAPDVRQARRTVGADFTTTACLPRRYCATCKNDVDCPSDNGVKQHCVADDKGAGFCTPECQNDGNCRKDAKCATKTTLSVDKSDANVCVPKAGTCNGDGSLCSPCRSDKDCPNGACITSPYTREQYCAVKSGKQCAIVNQKLVADCPQNNVANAPVGCQTTADDPNIPRDMCIGIITLGTGQNATDVDGCWAK